MGELNLDDIRANADWYRVNREGQEGAVEAYPWCAAAINCAEDVPALLAEVEQLRAELDDEQAAHAKTIDNFEICAEQWLAECTRQAGCPVHGDVRDCPADEKEDQ